MIAKRFLFLYLFMPITACAHSIDSAVDTSVLPAFDITQANGSIDGQQMTFSIDVAGVAGSVKPEPVGTLAGASVESYVWPTDLDPSVAGFDKASGILALAITAHPDFDDTPLFDENNDGDPANDGAQWHSHWVVLVEDGRCAAGLKVNDVSPGVDLLPPTAPQFPIALDSPGMSPRLDQHTASITVPKLANSDVKFDGVTARLVVNPKAQSPLLCVSTVHDIASGDLSLPGRVMTAK